MNRERTKTLILCILVVMSIVFTQKIWLHSPINAFEVNGVSKENRQSSIDEIRGRIVSPKRAVVSFGNNTYTVLSSDIDHVWDQSKLVLQDYFKGEAEVTSISYEKYIEASTLKSIELEFGQNIPSVLVSSVFNTLENKIVRNVREIKKILIPAYNRGTIYIIGRDNVFEIKLQNYSENNALTSYTDNMKEFVTYRVLLDFVGNYTLMPLSYNIPLPQIFVESDININDERTIIEKTKTFFNENFDFVKTIRETSGAINYMYGYGEKSVRINNKGRLEYNEEIGSASSTNVATSLDAAIDFMVKHEDLPEGTYLREIKNIKHGQNNGYYFGFGYRIGGFPVEFNANNMNHPIEIEVYGSKIKNYRTFLRMPMANVASITPERSVLSPYEIIDMEDNINIFKEAYVSREKNKEVELEEILKDIQSIEMVYFDTLEEGKEQILIPTWMFKVKDGLYFFDSYKGKLITSSVLN